MHRNRILKNIGREKKENGTFIQKFLVQTNYKKQQKIIPIFLYRSIYSCSNLFLRVNESEKKISFLFYAD